MPVLVAAWTALCAALKSVKLSAAVAIYAALVLSGVAGAEVFEHALRLRFLFIHIEGLGAQLADLKAKDATALKAAQAHVAAVTAAQTKATVDVMAAYAPTVAATAAQFQTLSQEVPTYVTPKNDSACAIPVGAVRLLDAAASGLPAVSLAPGGADDAPSGVALSTLVGADVSNDEAAVENAEQLAALQAWVRAQQAAQGAAAASASSAPVWRVIPTFP
jgi:hypothetical protein